MSKKKTLKGKSNKRKSNKKNIDAKRKNLEIYNANGYIEDLKIIQAIGCITDSERDWIETTMLRLRSCANMYEVLVGDFLIRKGVSFIHQAPFVLDGKKRFADFYIPSKHTVVEVDGEYHLSRFQSNDDNIRDASFAEYRIDTIRIPNNAANDEKTLELILHNIL